MYFIPEESYQHHDYITPKRTELISKFKRSCLDDQGLPKRPPPDGFCSNALVTLTSEFTSQTFTCNCNKRGSVSQECNRIGGHCKCKANVIGKNCDKCKTGYYGFPNCKGKLFFELCFNFQICFYHSFFFFEVHFFSTFLNLIISCHPFSTCTLSLKL